MSDLISRQTAINALYEWECDNKDERDAIDVVNGLPSVELSTNCISRQAVLNEFCHSCDGWSCNPNTCCKTEWIRKLPVVQPERKECEEREQGKCSWYAG